MYEIIALILSLLFDTLLIFMEIQVLLIVGKMCESCVKSDNKEDR